MPLKSHTITLYNDWQVVEGKLSIHFRTEEEKLRHRIEELESEVASLKITLEKVRKAKTTALLTKEGLMPHAENQPSNDSIRAQYQSEIDKVIKVLYSKTINQCFFISWKQHLFQLFAFIFASCNRFWFWDRGCQ